MRTRFPAHWAFVFVASVLIASSSLATAAGVQYTRDRSATLVNKDVGDERWAITYRISDGHVTGNVTIAGQDAPSFVDCSQESVSDDGVATFNCDGADACPREPCPDDQWSPLATATLPVDFFLPPEGPTPPLPACISDVSTNACSSFATDNCAAFVESSSDGDFQCKNSEDGSGRCERGEACTLD